MVLQSAGRPLGPLKTLLRQHRHARQLVARTMATETNNTTAPPAEAAPGAPVPPAAKAPVGPAPPTKFHVIRSTNPANPIRTAFAVYPQKPSARDAHPSALMSYHAQQIRRLDRTGARTKLFSRKNPDAAHVGDVLQVTTKRGEPFAGVCLSIRRSGTDTAFLLRNTLTKVGVEMWYKVYSPNVVKVEIIWRRPKRARRARLTYMRKPKHDMGNVEHLIESWRRSRNIYTTKKGKGGLGSKQAKAPLKK